MASTAGEHNPTSQKVPTLPFEVGTVLLGKYRVDRVIGYGGMGIVLAATHVQLQDQVAIKLLHAEVASKAQRVARFLREAQAAASLRSENVVRVFDVGQLESGMPYMVMELLEGQDLASGPIGPGLPVEDAVDYVVQACDAMAVAHARGMVHRDLKPANLFLVRDEHGIPTVKILDFGISKLKRPTRDDFTLTEAKEVMGSPLYMSPEQVRSARDVDSRADIWSLGTILYELVTGQTPFEGESLGAVLYAVVSDNPQPMTALRVDVPSGLSAVVARCLEKNPAHRYPTARELQQALLPFASVRSQAKMALRASSMPPSVLSGTPSAVPSVLPAAVPPAPVGARTSAAWTGTAAGMVRTVGARSPRWAVALGALALLAAIAFVVLWLRSRTVQVAGTPGPVVAEPADSVPFGALPAQAPPPAPPRVAPVVGSAAPPAPSQRTRARAMNTRAPATPVVPMPVTGGTSGAQQAEPSPPLTPPVSPPKPKNGMGTERPHRNPLDIDFK